MYYVRREVQTSGNVTLFREIDVVSHPLPIHVQGTEVERSAGQGLGALAIIAPPLPVPPRTLYYSPVCSRFSRLL